MQTQHGQSLQGANDTKFCLTFSLITPLFSSLSMNLRGILTRTEVLHFLNSQVLFQLVKSREYRPPSKPSQPYVTIKTNREKPRWGLTSLASTLLVPGRPSGPPYLHLNWGGLLVVNSFLVTKEFAVGYLGGLFWYMEGLGFRSSVILTLSLISRASTSSLIVSKSPSICQTELLVSLAIRTRTSPGILAIITGINNPPYCSEETPNEANPRTCTLILS